MPPAGLGLRGSYVLHWCKEKAVEVHNISTIYLEIVTLLTAAVPTVEIMYRRG